MVLRTIFEAIEVNYGLIDAHTDCYGTDKKYIHVRNVKRWKKEIEKWKRLEEKIKTELYGANRLYKNEEVSSVSFQSVIAEAKKNFDAKNKL